MVWNDYGEGLDQWGFGKTDVFGVTRIAPSSWEGESNDGERRGRVLRGMKDETEWDAREFVHVVGNLETKEGRVGSTKALVEFGRVVWELGGEYRVRRYLEVSAKAEELRQAALVDVQWHGATRGVAALRALEGVVRWSASVASEVVTRDFGRVWRLVLAAEKERAAAATAAAALGLLGGCIDGGGSRVGRQVIVRFPWDAKELRQVLASSPKVRSQTARLMRRCLDTGQTNALTVLFRQGRRLISILLREGFDDKVTFVGALRDITRHLMESEKDKLKILKLVFPSSVINAIVNLCDGVERADQNLDSEVDLICRDIIQLVCSSAKLTPASEVVRIMQGLRPTSSQTRFETTLKVAAARGDAGIPLLSSILPGCEPQLSVSWLATSALICQLLELRNSWAIEPELEDLYPEGFVNLGILDRALSHPKRLVAFSGLQILDCLLRRTSENIGKKWGSVDQELLRKISLRMPDIGLIVTCIRKESDQDGFVAFLALKIMRFYASRTPWLLLESRVDLRKLIFPFDMKDLGSPLCQFARSQLLEIHARRSPHALFGSSAQKISYFGYMLRLLCGAGKLPDDVCRNVRSAIELVMRHSGMFPDGKERELASLLLAVHLVNQGSHSLEAVEDAIREIDGIVSEGFRKPFVFLDTLEKYGFPYATEPLPFSLFVVALLTKLSKRKQRTSADRVHVIYISSVLLCQRDPLRMIRFIQKMLSTTENPEVSRLLAFSDELASGANNRNTNFSRLVSSFGLTESAPVHADILRRLFSRVSLMRNLASHSRCWEHRDPWADYELWEMMVDPKTGQDCWNDLKEENYLVQAPTEAAALCVLFLVETPPFSASLTNLVESLLESSFHVSNAQRAKLFLWTRITNHFENRQLCADLVHPLMKTLENDKSLLNERLLSLLEGIYPLLDTEDRARLLALGVQNTMSCARAKFPRQVTGSSSEAPTILTSDRSKRQVVGVKIEVTQDPLISLNQLDSKILRDTADCVGTRGQASGVYDLHLVLSICYHALFVSVQSSDEVFPIQKFILEGALGVCFACLSSPQVEIRRISYANLALFTELLGPYEVASTMELSPSARLFRDRKQILFLLNYLQDSLPMPLECLPFLITTFLRFSAQILIQPTHDLYPWMYKRLLRSSILDFHDAYFVKEFLFPNDNNHLVTLRHLGLQLVELGCKTVQDFEMLRRRRIPEDLMAIGSLTFGLSTSTRSKVWRAIDSLVKEEASLMHMIQREGVIAWLASLPANSLDDEVIVVVFSLLRRCCALSSDYVALVARSFSVVIDRFLNARSSIPETVLSAMLDAGDVIIEASPWTRRLFDISGPVVKLLVMTRETAPNLWKDVRGFLPFVRADVVWEGNILTEIASSILDDERLSRKVSKLVMVGESLLSRPDDLFRDYVLQHLLENLYDSQDQELLFLTNFCALGALGSAHWRILGDLLSEMPVPRSLEIRSLQDLKCISEKPVQIRIAEAVKCSLLTTGRTRKRRRLESSMNGTR